MSDGREEREEREVRIERENREDRGGTTSTATIPTSGSRSGLTHKGHAGAEKVPWLLGWERIRKWSFTTMKSGKSPNTTAGLFLVDCPAETRCISQVGQAERR
jgi:hypothetical protein